MTTHTFDDEILMAYADGELDAATAELVEQAMETDDAVAERVALFLETRLRARSEHEPAEDVPPALRASVEKAISDARDREEVAQASAVVALRVAANDRKRKKIDVPMPIAASIFAALAGLIGYSIGVAGYTDGADLRMAGLSVPGLPALLSSSPSGTEVAMGDTQARFRAIATFTQPDGTLCREFEVSNADRSTLVSVACRQDRNWRVDFAVVARGGDDGYAPASSLESLDAYLGAISAGEPVDLDEEAALLAADR